MNPFETTEFSTELKIMHFFWMIWFQNWFGHIDEKVTDIDEKVTDIDEKMSDISNRVSKLEVLTFLNRNLFCSAAYILAVV